MKGREREREGGRGREREKEGERGREREREGFGIDNCQMVEVQNGGVVLSGGNSKAKPKS